MAQRSMDSPSDFGGAANRIMGSGRSPNADEPWIPIEHPILDIPSRTVSPDGFHTPTRILPVEETDDDEGIQEPTQATYHARRTGTRVNDAFIRAWCDRQQVRLLAMLVESHGLNLDQ